MEILTLVGYVDFSALKFETYKEKSGWTRYRTMVVCIGCGKNFYKDKRNFTKAVRRGVFTGKCFACSRKRFGKDHPNYKGGYVSRGYRIISVKGRWVREHRYVVERMLGRSLMPYEHVHHVDGNKLNNSEENLVLVNNVEHSLITKLTKEMNELRIEVEKMKSLLVCLMIVFAIRKGVGEPCP